MSSFEILCATMHQQDFSKIREMNIHSDVIFANQTDCYGYMEKQFEGKTARLISTPTRGVGVNRNIALLSSKADIVMFADDDVVYEDGLEENVLRAFEEFPDADAIVFGGKYQKNGEIYLTRTLPKGKLPFYKAMKFGAVLIAVRRAAVEKHNITFTTLFGGGCIYSHGEDSDFLIQCYKKGLKFYSHDFVMGTTVSDTSTWFTGYDNKYFYDTGAFARNAFGVFAYEYMAYMALRIKSDELSIPERLKQMNNGYKGFKTLTPYKG